VAEPETKSKLCPDCAEEVKEAANVCRFCGYRFDGDARGQIDSSPPIEAVQPPPRGSAASEVAPAPPQTEVAANKPDPRFKRWFWGTALGAFCVFFEFQWWYDPLLEGPSGAHTRVDRLLRTATPWVALGLVGKLLLIVAALATVGAPLAAVAASASPEGYKLAIGVRSMLVTLAFFATGFVIWKLIVPPSPASAFGTGAVSIREAFAEFGGLTTHLKVQESSNGTIAAIAWGLLWLRWVRYPRRRTGRSIASAAKVA
jgi:hypothetical protein